MCWLIGIDEEGYGPNLGPFVTTATAHSRKRLPRRCRVQGVVVCPRRFNAVLDERGSKGAVLADALTALVSHFRHLEDEEEPVYFVIDKHGGRNNYAAMLQHAFA